MLATTGERSSTPPFKVSHDTLLKIFSYPRFYVWGFSSEVLDIWKIGQLKAVTFTKKGLGVLALSITRKLLIYFLKKRVYKISDQLLDFTIIRVRQCRGLHDFILKGSISTSKNSFKVYCHWIFWLSQTEKSNWISEEQWCCSPF